jgi:hypothetical protein
MPELNDLWDWIAYVRESNAYLIALPSFVALFLACFTDWVERRQTSNGTIEGQLAHSSASGSAVLATAERRAARQLNGLHVGAERATAFGSSQPNDRKEATRSGF